MALKRQIDKMATYDFIEQRLPQAEISERGRE